MVTAKKVVPIKKEIAAWSFSRLNDHTKCPTYAWFKHGLKMKEPGSVAMDRGSAIHSIAQKFSRAGAKVKCPEELECFVEEFQQVQKIKTALTEQQWAFNRRWEPVDWFAEDAWCRVVVDLSFVGKSNPKRRYVVDYKTGKINPDHLNQLSLYGLAVLLMFPEMDEAAVELWYLDHGVIKPDDEKIYTQADVPALKAEWETKALKMTSDKHFKEKPSSSCGYCHFSKGKGGPCKF